MIPRSSSRLTLFEVAGCESPILRPSSEIITNGMTVTVHHSPMLDAWY
jgi:hypothetical protein